MAPTVDACCCSAWISCPSGCRDSSNDRSCNIMHRRRRRYLHLLNETKVQNQSKWTGNNLKKERLGKVRLTNFDTDNLKTRLVAWRHCGIFKRWLMFLVTNFKAMLLRISGHLGCRAHTYGGSLSYSEEQRKWLHPSRNLEALVKHSKNLCKASRRYKDLVVGIVNKYSSMQTRLKLFWHFVDR